MKQSIACILVKDSKIFIAKRLPIGQMGGRWEFPGGKVEKDETLEEAIVREFEEEFSVKVSVGNIITKNKFTHNGNDVELTAFEIFIKKEPLDWILTEHTEIDWIEPEKIPSLNFVDSDLLIYPDVLKYIQEKY